MTSRDNVTSRQDDDVTTGWTSFRTRTSDSSPISFVGLGRRFDDDPGGRWRRASVNGNVGPILEEPKFFLIRRRQRDVDCRSVFERVIYRGLLRHCLIVTSALRGRCMNVVSIRWSDRCQKLQNSSSLHLFHKAALNSSWGGKDGYPTEIWIYRLVSKICQFSYCKICIDCSFTN